MSTTLTCADLLTPSGSMRIDVRANMGLWCYQLNSNQYDCDMYYAHAPNSGRNTLCLHPTDGGNTCDASDRFICSPPPSPPNPPPSPPIPGIHSYAEDANYRYMLRTSGFCGDYNTANGLISLANLGSESNAVSVCQAAFLAFHGARMYLEQVQLPLRRTAVAGIDYLLQSV